MKIVIILIIKRYLFRSLWRTSKLQKKSATLANMTLIAVFLWGYLDPNSDPLPLFLDPIRIWVQLLFTNCNIVHILLSLFTVKAHILCIRSEVCKKKDYLFLSLGLARCWRDFLYVKTLVRKKRMGNCITSPPRAGPAGSGIENIFWEPEHLSRSWWPRPQHHILHLQPSEFSTDDGHDGHAHNPTPYTCNHQNLALGTVMMATPTTPQPTPATIRIQH